MLDELAGLGGSCSPSDYEAFEFNSAAAFRAPVKALEDSNLVISSKADSDKRRKTVSMTSRGWLVMHAREGQSSLDNEA